MDLYRIYYINPLIGEAGGRLIGGGSGGAEPPREKKGTGDAQTDVQFWNGTTWATSPSLATARSNGARGGTTSAGLVCGGYPHDPSPPGQGIATEEFTPETTAVNIVDITTS